MGKGCSNQQKCKGEVRSLNKIPIFRVKSLKKKNFNNNWHVTEVILSIQLNDFFSPI